MILKANLSYLLLTLYFTLFPVAHEVNTSASDINNDLNLVSDWTFLWKTSFNGDHSKQAEEIIFSRKKNEVIPPKRAFQWFSG